ncbi:hypothetical protein [Sabulicella glaciei]|uniref:DUF4136 domain-containing protein n=1 Tax=Sabulicella glaciei TaxID=2984948 RepID=A0ABT3NV35_9PROT|nr:hypothetical protein [Roseococcus sp. MDT2-1-1]MCW8086014.1 hypothetical protein [Roseococcus sp. MDT2-1-1]
MRRRVLLLALPAAACASPPPPRVEGPPIGYGHLTQLRLDVSSVEIDGRDPLPGPGDLGRELSPSAVDAVRIMGRDRLSAFGTENRAVFSVPRAQITRDRQGGGGVFSGGPTERLEARLAARLEIQDPNGRRLGFAEAETSRVRTGVDSNPAARRAAAESLLRQAMFDLNTEFEFQIRRTLRPYLTEGPGRGPAPAAGVEREALPPS